MGQVGRPRGRPSKRSQLLHHNLVRPVRQQHPLQAKAANGLRQGKPSMPSSIQIANGLATYKEDTGPADKADILSFRTDALHRYITNHSYIENVTSKLIHTSNINPPTLLPTATPGIPADPYDFTDLEATKKLRDLLVDEMEEIKSDRTVLDKHTSCCGDLCEDLAAEYASTLIGDVSGLVQKLALVVTTLAQAAGKKYQEHTPRMFLVDLGAVQQAPAGYDPNVAREMMHTTISANLQSTGLVPGTMYREMPALPATSAPLTSPSVLGPSHVPGTGPGLVTTSDSVSVPGPFQRNSQVSAVDMDLFPGEVDELMFGGEVEEPHAMNTYDELLFSNGVM